MEVETANSNYHPPILKNSSSSGSIGNTSQDKEKSKKSVKFVAQEETLGLSPGSNGKAGGMDGSKVNESGEMNGTDQHELELENTWCFWEDHFNSNHGELASVNEYAASLSKLATFHTVQGFWSEFNKLPHLSQVPNNSCFHLMKHGIRPVWEDRENLKGGLLIIKVKKFRTDELWNELVLTVIGEQFSQYLDPSDDICGLSIRKKQGLDFNTIHIWNKNVKGAQNIERAFKHLTHNLSDCCIHVYYREHQYEFDRMKKNQEATLKFQETLKKNQKEIELKQQHQNGDKDLLHHSNSSNSSDTSSNNSDENEMFESDLYLLYKDL